MSAVPGRPARRRVRARLDATPCRHSDRRSRGLLRDHRELRARHQPRDRRDDDRPDRRGHDLPNSPSIRARAAETMTAFIGATGIGDVPTGSIEYKTIFAVGLTLFAFTLVMNMIAIRLVRKWREVYEYERRGPRPTRWRPGDRVRGGLFHGLLLVSITIGFVLLVTLLIDVFQKGRALPRWRPALRRAIVVAGSRRRHGRRSSGRST